MSWLNELVSQTEEYESPKQFFYWAGLSALSAIVKDKVWIERAGGLQVYLNIYVLLFARSGLRKGPPIDLAKRLVRRIGNTRVISGRSSMEAIIEDLKEVQTNKDTKSIIVDSCGFITASEFSAAIVRSDVALNLLTDMYDRRYNDGEYAVRLIRTGKNILKNPTVSMLGGINEAHFKNFLEHKDITGGFLARTFIIYAEGKNMVNSLMYDMHSQIDEEKLCEHLRLVEKLKGPMKICDKGKMLYDSWYKEFYKDPVDDKTGTYERVGDSALKIAGLLSLANNVSLEIEPEHILSGIEMAEKFISSARHVTFTSHEEESMSTLKKKVLKILMKREDHKITKARLLQDLYGVMNSEDLIKIQDTLEHAGLIKVYLFGDNVVYEMSKETVKKLKSIMGEEK